jgi:hypothetical protein
VRACVRVRACVCLRTRACACKRGLYGHGGGTAATGGIYSSACNGRTDTCAFALVIGRSPICAAGATWTSRTLSAPWAARRSHTSVIDAAGAIYVIGGSSGTRNYLEDFWVSTDGGADQTREGGTRRVLGGTHGVFRGSARVPRDYLRGTPMVLPGDCTHARGRSSRGALAHSRGYSAGYYCRGGFGGNIILRGARWALQHTPGGARRYS